MAWHPSLLVVASQTADSNELRAALKERAKHGQIEVTMLIPATLEVGGRDAAEARLQSAIEHLQEEGIDAKGGLGDSDPAVAVREVWDPGRFDEVIVSTLPTGTSKWLDSDIVRRLQKITDAPVTHVLVPLPKPAPSAVAPPERRGALVGLLSTLAYSRRENS